MESEKYLEGQSMQRPPLFESDEFIYWKDRFETYVKLKDLDVWHINTDGDFSPTRQEEESIDNAFAKFNTIITSLKELDEESKNLTTLSLDELIGNLKVYEEPHKERNSFQRIKDDKKGKGKRKCFKCGDPNHLIGECLKLSRYHNQKAFVGGSWSDSDEDEEEKTKDKKCLMAKASNEKLALSKAHRFVSSSSSYHQGTSSHQHDDDDVETSQAITPSPTDNIIFKLPSCVAITPNEPIASLSMGDEHLNTILATESDKFIKSCVKNLDPNPSESDGENECDVPAGFTTFSNVLFNADYDFDSGDDPSTSDEDFPKKIYSNPLFDEEINPMKIDQHPFNAESDLIESMLNHDSSINISSKTDSVFDEFAGELTLLKSISPGIDETDCHPEKETRFAKRLLYENSSPRPPKEIISENFNAEIESFSSSPIPNKDSDSHMEEIDLPFTPDDPMPPGIEKDDDDSERDIPIFEELLDNYSLSLPDNESYHFDIPSPYRPPAKPPDGNIGTLNIKMMGDISDQKVPIPNLTITRILNQEKSPKLLSHLGLEIFQPSAECSMMINGKNTPLLDVPLFHFYPP
nr:zf-CCHC domain-containing protein/DUF4219 domain-containing protein/UBN2 domain-containing protein [Tanacetum cinerariifolium]